MHKRVALNGLALLGLLASSTVLAEIEPGFYVGAGVGKAAIELDTEDAGFTFDSDDTAFKVFGGYNFNPYVALEAAYFDGGDPEEVVIRIGPNTGTVEAGPSGLIASVLGRAPLGDVASLYVKLGFASYDVDIKGRVNGDVISSETVTEEDVAYGVGASFNLGSTFELRAEYEAVDVADGNFNMMTVNGLFKF